MKAPSLILTAILLLSFFTMFGQHSVVLKTGERLEGVVLELQNDELLMSVNRQPRKIQVKDVSSIFFNEHIPYDGSLKQGTPVKTIQSGDYTIEYNMKDREMVTPPKISNATEKKGTVVVEVIINRSGTVLESKAGVVGSTTSDEYLLTKAEYACRGARFNEHMTGPIETTGTITIHY